MFRIRKIYVSLVMILAVGFVINILATDSVGQKDGKGRYRKVTLKENAKKNGYKIVAIEGHMNLKLIMVIDPETKKPAVGEWRVEYRCKPGEGLTFGPPVTLFNGSAQTVFEPCLRPFVTSIVPVVG